MTEEPTHKEISDDDGAPATKGDIRAAQEELAQATAKSFSAVDRRFDGVESRLDRIEGKLDDFATKDQVATVLNVIQSIDQRLKEWADIPERVSKLEEDVAELALRR